MSRKKKRSFIGYIGENWGFKKYTHRHLAGFHECIGIDKNICTTEGLRLAGKKGRIKCRITVEEIGDLLE